MIALRDEIPLIQLSDGQAVAYERQWLTRSLARAARKAGYPQWWLAEHVTESVAEYLRNQREITILPVERLDEAVRGALQVIGYGEIAHHFLPGRPCVRVSLHALAIEAGTGYELAFFDLLGRRLQELAREDGCNFELSGLDRAVKLLRNRKVWCRDCDGLQAEIISFVREQTALAAGANEVVFTLA